MRVTADQTFPIRLELNGRSREALAEPRTQLCDFLRHDLGATGVMSDANTVSAVPAQCWWTESRCVPA